MKGWITWLFSELGSSPPPTHQTACAEERYQGMAIRSLKLMDGQSGLCGIRDVSKQSTFRAMPSEHTRGSLHRLLCSGGSCRAQAAPIPPYKLEERK